ncbi:MAG: MotA/TolQ/ExbB proton channel family protein [Neisseriaceae bacterium]
MNFITFLKQNDCIVVLDLLVLLIMSLFSWTIAIVKWLELRAAKKRNMLFAEQLQKETSWNFLSHKENKNTGPMESLARSLALAKAEYQELFQLQQHISLDEFISRQLRKYFSQALQPFNNWLVVLASIGSMAPFVGLFGTVIGIYRALINVSQHGQVSIAEVAGPIGEALIATAFGLFVAIPAVLFYNAFVRKNSQLKLELGLFAEQLRIKLMGQESK